jgi:hypothetical protein
MGWRVFMLTTKQQPVATGTLQKQMHLPRLWGGSFWGGCSIHTELPRGLWTGGWGRKELLIHYQRECPSRRRRCLDPPGGCPSHLSCSPAAFLVELEHKGEGLRETTLHTCFLVGGLLALGAQGRRQQRGSGSYPRGPCKGS